MYEWVSPDALIPVHGEYRHLKEQVKFQNYAVLINKCSYKMVMLLKLIKVL